jgi:molybdopterin-guanine dinucleotide biosynthesis protein A
MIRVRGAAAGKAGGYVLVGGRSSRMGRDKALLPHHGTALAAGVAHEVERATGQCVLVGDPARYGQLGYEVAADLYPGEGPLGGILTALRHSREDWNVLVACDMPRLSAEFLHGLIDEAVSRRDIDVLAPLGPSGRFEPLCSVYHRRSAPALQAAFDAGVRRIAEAAAGLRLEAIAVAELTPLDNVNTPEDWARYAAE